MSKIISEIELSANARRRAASLRRREQTPVAKPRGSQFSVRSAGAVSRMPRPQRRGWARIIKEWIL